MESENLINNIFKIESKATRIEEFSNYPAVLIPVDVILSFMKKLHDDSNLQFDMLFDHTAVDLPHEESIKLVYQLFSTKLLQHLTVLVIIPRHNPVISSVSSVWKIAEWQEREVYDLFGVLYNNHPDLRRLFLEDDWKGFPLRKDYKDDFMLEP